MPIKAIIGLGNTGKQYQDTYHNIGTKAVQYFKEKISPESTVEFFIPPGFMNMVGAPISRFLKQRQLQAAEVLIIHDDSDLRLGEFKLIQGGSSAGHKGIQSLIENLGTDQFWRLKIGIRDPKERVRKKAEEFVLKKIRFVHRLRLSRVFEEALEKLIPLLSPTLI